MSKPREADNLTNEQALGLLEVRHEMTLIRKRLERVRRKMMTLMSNCPRLEPGEPGLYWQLRSVKEIVVDSSLDALQADQRLTKWVGKETFWKHSETDKC